MILKPGETAPVSGKYVEVGQGGGKVKRAQQIYVNQGEILPMLSPYSIKIEHKGSSEVRNRQHCWKLVQ
ncbi:YjzC family protein [Neobacillus sp. WH10]|uniref:YjzC family protein n=1 Tax=Neobacillus sp. WH10 TaxID=3047873 RepID=UPI0024C14D5A|nr:YjzC family protein [Neobacillus sp. WH10]WHY79872.1 YjzC family protein [Neobacillus sp. WH10]